ncbi:MAG TPA: MATE family efflux transporter [Bryobacteraceae bacterium]|nr:MATE family efflux transporter [Bryobacteraceae bacterium]
MRRVLRLAVPVAMGELGWMAMTTVDTIMVGKLGAPAIGAIGVGNSAFYSFAIFGMGLLLGLDTLVSQSCGAGDREDCHRSLTQGVYLALALTVPLMLLFNWMPPLFRILGIVEPVSTLAGTFIRVLNLSTLPLLLYGAFRRYLQGMGHVAPVMFALISANLVNWFFNWLLIQGHWGFPSMGVAGSALSTCFARLYMAAVLAFAIWWYERGLQPGFGNLLRRPDAKRLARLIRLGFPAATQILLEIGAFGAAAVLAGRLTPDALAAHQIALNCAALSFMVPLGTASAAAVAVGHAIGRGDWRMARRNGFIAMGLACSFMFCSALVFLFLPGPVLRIYTNDPGVLRTGAGLLALAALFQLFDGTQTVATGALRGLGETRGPMIANLAGYWAFGLPIGYALCFHFGLGVYGLWWGLTLALIAISLVLFWEWSRRSRTPAPYLHPEHASSH